MSTRYSKAVAFVEGFKLKKGSEEYAWADEYATEKISMLAKIYDDIDAKAQSLINHSLTAAIAVPTVFAFILKDKNESLVPLIPCFSALLFAAGRAISTVRPHPFSTPALIESAYGHVDEYGDEGSVRFHASFAKVEAELADAILVKARKLKKGYRLLGLGALWLVLMTAVSLLASVQEGSFLADPVPWMVAGLVLLPVWNLILDSLDRASKYLKGKAWGGTT